MRALAALLLLGACSSAAPVASEATTSVRMSGAFAQTSLGPPTLELAEGVAAAPSTCAEGASEVCNAIDDDCDEAIDEDCGLARGALEITLAWTGSADLDLYVTDPSGATLSALSQVTPSGGMLDHSAQGDCDRREALNHLEHAVWLSAVSGRYAIEIHHWGTCGGTGETPATIGIAVGGRSLGSFRLTLSPRRERAVAELVVP